MQQRAGARVEHSIQPTPAELMKEKMRCNHAQQHSTRTLCPPHAPHAREQRIRVSGGTGRHVHAVERSEHGAMWRERGGSEDHMPDD